MSPGWRLFPRDPAVSAWVAAVRAAALAAADDPALAHWWRAGGTWFVGVNALDNDATGQVGTGPPLAGAAITAIAAALGERPALDRAQVSICRPGYPSRDRGDSEASHRYRLARDGAHVDGLKPVGPDRRVLSEPHAFLLGLPLTEADPGASPLAVWEGSHEVMARALGRELSRHPPRDWPGIDLAETYRQARRHCFETCRRITIHARPGEAFLVHRLALHGIAPWQEGAQAAPEGRAMAYFRPLLRDWTHWPDLSASAIP